MEAKPSAHWPTNSVVLHTVGGEYLLRATATDRLDRRATSDAISVQLDNTPPESRLAEPLEMAVIGGHVRLFAETTDSGSGVVGVRFEYARAADSWKELGATTNAPYAAMWDTTHLPDGAYQLRCLARDLTYTRRQGAPCRSSDRRGAHGVAGAQPGHEPLPVAPVATPLRPLVHPSIRPRLTAKGRAAAH